MGGASDPVTGTWTSIGNGSTNQPSDPSHKMYSNPLLPVTLSPLENPVEPRSHVPSSLGVRLTVPPVLPSRTVTGVGM